MLIRDAQVSDADHLVRFVNMAADELSLHFWKKSAGPGVDPLAYGQERAARETGNFSYRTPGWPRSMARLRPAFLATPPRSSLNRSSRARPRSSCPCWSLKTSPPVHGI